MSGTRRLRRPVLPRLPRLGWRALLTASAAGGGAIALLAAMEAAAGLPLLIAAFGSSCVLVFLVPDSPFSRPNSLVGGHLVAAASGLAVATLWPACWWSLGLAVALAMAAMAALRVIHPPAGGTPIAMLLADVDWSYLVTPVLLGSLALSALGLAFRLLSPVPRQGADATAASARR